jgi:hypothetical protein
MEGQDAKRLAQVISQCPALAHLNLIDNFNFGSVGTESLPGVLGKSGSWCIFISAAIKLEQPVLTECTALTHLDFS